MKKAICLAVVLGLFVGCRVPDLRPFSDATAAMATVLKLGFDHTQAALGAAAQTADAQGDFARQVRALDERWKPTRRQADQSLVLLPRCFHHPPHLAWAGPTLLHHPSSEIDRLPFPLVLFYLPLALRQAYVSRRPVNRPPKTAPPREGPPLG